MHAHLVAPRCIMVESGVRFSFDPVPVQIYYRSYLGRVGRGCPDGVAQDPEGEDGRGPDEEAMRKRLTYVRMDVVAASLRSAVHVSDTSAENCMHP